MPRKNPCAVCADGNCACCLNSPENSIRIKLYTPKGAARAMLVGAVLKDGKGWSYWWNKSSSTFCCKGKESKQSFPVCNFSGLYEEKA